MTTQKIIDMFRFAAQSWDWTRVARYYEQYPGLHARFDRELHDLTTTDLA